MERTLIHVILDASGSMQKIKQKTIDGFNEYVDSLKKHGDVVKLSLTQFSSRATNEIYSDVAVSHISELVDASYRPDGNTPLYDAVGKVLTSLEKKISKMADTPAVLVVVITDGEENCSNEYNQRQVLDLITEKEKVGWNFLYLGANQDSWGNAKAIGIQRFGASLDYAHNDDGVVNCYANLAATTDRYFQNRSETFCSTGHSNTMGYDGAFVNLDSNAVDEYAANIKKRGKEKNGTKKSV